MSISFFNSRDAYWEQPWPYHWASCVLLLGNTWALGFVAAEWGVRLLLGWWQVCWFWGRKDAA